MSWRSPSFPTSAVAALRRPFDVLGEAWCVYLITSAHLVVCSLQAHHRARIAHEVEAFAIGSA